MALAIPALAPLASSHPPFQDWPGHLGAAGAFIHLGEPEAHVERFLAQQRWLGPNGALYLLIAALARIMSPELAGAIVLALSLAAIAVAALRLCRAAGAERELAILALPVAFARPTYAGFIPNVAATAMMIAAFAAHLDHRREGRTRDLVLQVILQTTLPLMHAFIALASYGIVALWSAIDLKRSRRSALGGFGSVAAGALVLVALFRDGGGGRLEMLLRAEHGHLASDFWSWLIAFRGGTILDDLGQIAWLAPIAAVLAIRRDWNEAQVRLGIAALAVLMAFVLIPMDLGAPVSWWAARGRLPAIAILLAIPLLRVERAIWISMIASIAIAVGSLAELAIWERTVMRGFAEVLDRLPPGRAVSVLWYDVDPERRFPGAPLGHAGGWYVLAKGGGTAQTFFEPAGSETIAARALPFALVRPIPGPPWGIAELFDWSVHAEGVEIFVVRGRDDAPRAPFYGDQLAGWSSITVPNSGWSAWLRSLPPDRSPTGEARSLEPARPR